MRRPIVVTKGQAVTMLFNAPGVELTATGRAMSEGGVGDTVMVQNPASFRTINGVISAPAPSSPRAPLHPISVPRATRIKAHAILFKISITILGAALCGCSAVDRIQNIGSTPKMAPGGQSR